VEAQVEAQVVAQVVAQVEVGHHLVVNILICFNNYIFL
jgi:hypothetical protein